MEKLFTAKLHVGVEEPHTLCGGALSSLADDIQCELELNLAAVVENIKQKFAVREDGGKGRVKIVVDF